ncbi:hypothetical protein [Actinoplanes sp. NPDC051859]|uniref:hypothetical protein n=1 Tax=Actinoplanes sp. NPDC051859 TaxID=3363909 RepID=UPI00379426D2
MSATGPTPKHLTSPAAGVLWLFPILAWRVAYLPHRDWPPREDELPRVAYLPDLAHVGPWICTDPEAIGETTMT